MNKSKAYNIDWSHLGEDKQEYRKTCFCVGAKNCNDNNCPLVKQHKEQMKKYCECCGQLKEDVRWREGTEQYECKECYQTWVDGEYGK